jgi:hypothetical protein
MNDTQQTLELEPTRTEAGKVRHSTQPICCGRVLIACESSGVVREAFKARGWDAWSCDTQESEQPGQHYQCDVREILNDGWDLMIAHPPCTYLCVSGMHRTLRGLRDPQLTEDALDFVRLLMNAPIPHIAIENPVGVISTRIRKPDQYIQPYEFGDDASKTTGLRLKYLPLLRGTSFVEPRYVCKCGCVFEYSLGKYGCPNCEGENKVYQRWANQTDSGQNRLPPSKDRWKERSKTYIGVANAMADQWTDFYLNHNT